MSMAEHENSIGESDEWYTPPEIFDALGLTFDLDPCSPGGRALGAGAADLHGAG
jgi:hypothetical protein